MEEIHIQCPYCLQAISILLDTGVYGHETIVEDCEVCCRPIEVSFIVEDGAIKTYSYNSIYSISTAHVFVYKCISQLKTITFDKKD